MAANNSPEGGRKGGKGLGLGGSTTSIFHLASATIILPLPSSGWGATAAFTAAAVHGPDAFVS